MDKSFHKNLIEDTFENSFNKEKFLFFIKNFLNKIDESKAFHARGYVKEKFKDVSGIIKTYERLGTYTDPNGKNIDVLVVYLGKDNSIDRARTSLRNFVSDYLKQRAKKDAGLVAFVPPSRKDWRFSFVKMEYELAEDSRGKLKGMEKFTPARRYSFLVGVHESSHTAKSRLVPILEDDVNNPTLEQLEESFHIEKVTKEFFEKYRELYHKVKEALDELVNKDSAIKNDFQQKKVSNVDFAKKLLGQIIFLYFLQKKGWFGVKRNEEWGFGSKRFLRELFEKKHGGYKNFFNDILEPLFYEALRLEHPGDYYSHFDCRIPFLNGGLFDPINDYDWWDTDILLPDEVFSNNRKTKEGDTGDGILDVFDRYNFTVKEDEPLEKEVAIDPETLGKVFENLLEVKDRKSKGTYYTPREIVHYMCQESLANYLTTELDGKVKKEDIDTLIRYGETFVEHDNRVINGGQETKAYSFKLPQSVREHAKLIDEKLASIRVCDSAVGSGAFPVGMMTEVIRVRNALTSHIGEDGDRTSYNFKRHAIQYCLYGVDIDPGAIEIAKLRLWLSLIVDEEEREKIQPLPNLDYKIVCGNSLLGYPYKPSWTQEVESLKKKFLLATSPKIKQELKNQIDTKLKGFLENSEKSLGYKVDFDFEIFFSEVFHEKKGFDVVIANPPYVSHVNFSKKEKTLIQRNFQTYKGRADLYVAFYEQGIRILKSDGHLTYITPNKFFRAGYGEDLRRFLESNTKTITIIDFGDSPIFDATTYPSILLLQKAKSLDYKFNFLQAKKPIDLFKRDSFTKLLSSYLSNDLWTFENKNLIQIWKKIKSSSENLREYINNDFYRGIVTGLNKAFIIDEKQKNVFIKKNILISEIIKPYLRGKNVKRWVSKSDSYIIFTYHGIDISRFPEILDYLKPFKCKLEKRATSKNHKWYELQQPQTGIFHHYKQTKIISTDIAKRCEFTIDISGSFIDNTIFCIPLNDLYLLSLLNSRLIEAYYRSQTSSIRGDFLRFKKIYLDLLPIKEIEDDKKIAFRNLAEKILNITRSEDYFENSAKKAKVREFEKQIDQLVYKLYGLTSKEIEVIENSVKK